MSESITVTHPNGYSGVLFGESSMSIFKGDKEVLHTGFRNAGLRSAEDLYSYLEKVPVLLSSLGLMSDDEIVTSDLTADQIIDRVSVYYSISKDKILSSLRSVEVVKARNVAMFLCRTLLDMKYEDIGEVFGGRKHTTVMHSCSMVAGDISLSKDIESIRGSFSEAV